MGAMLQCAALPLPSFYKDAALISRCQGACLSASCEQSKCVTSADILPTEFDWQSSDARRRALLLGVPMLKSDALVGIITSTAKKCGRSPTNRSSWLQSFADQAVIAIENTRLLNELQARTTTSRVAGAADGDLRGAQRHQQFARRA